MSYRLTLSKLTRSVCWTVLLLFPVAGCNGSDRATVAGTLLRHDGSPLASAQVFARSEETGQWASGTTDARGRFKLGTIKPGDGIPPGDYNVTITEDRGDRGPARPATIAAKYQNAATSELSLKVEPGKRTVFDATLDPP